MKKVTKAPLAVDVVALPGAQRALERLADLLAKIQKVNAFSLRLVITRPGRFALLRVVPHPSYCVGGPPHTHTRTK